MDVSLSELRVEVSYVRAYHVVAIPQSGLLAQVNSLRLPLGHSGSVLTLSNAARASLPRPHLLVAQKSKMAVWGGLTNSCEKKRSKKQSRQEYWSGLPFPSPMIG